jgi:hypothetical protein
MDQTGDVGVRHVDFSVGGDPVTGVDKSTDGEFAFPWWECGE